MNIRNIYISGRITGEAISGVIAKFRAAERKIRRFGFTPVSPLDNGLPFEAEWADHMGRDIALLLKCDAIYLLPDYEQSRGAQIELCVALQQRMPVFVEREPRHRTAAFNPCILEDYEPQEA